MASITGGWIGRCAEQTYSSPHHRAIEHPLRVRPSPLGVLLPDFKSRKRKSMRKSSAKEDRRRKDKQACYCTVREVVRRLRSARSDTAEEERDIVHASPGAQRTRRLGHGLRIFDFERAEVTNLKSYVGKLGHRTRTPFDIEHYNSTACQRFTVPPNTGVAGAYCEYLLLCITSTSHKTGQARRTFIN